MLSLYFIVLSFYNERLTIEDHIAYMGKTQLPTNFSKHTSNNPCRKILINKFYSCLTKTIKPLHPQTILDAGCGEGFTLNQLSQQHIGTSLEGIDNNKEAIALGKTNFPNLILKQASIYGLPYKDNTFDVVISTEVLEHLDKPEQALAEIMRVSKKYVVISVPNEPFFMLSRLIMGVNILQFGNHPEHINHWTFLSFKLFLQKNRGKVIGMQYPFPWILALVEK